MAICYCRTGNLHKRASIIFWARKPLQKRAQMKNDLTKIGVLKTCPYEHRRKFTLDSIEIHVFLTRIVSMHQNTITKKGADENWPYKNKCLTNLPIIGR